MRKAMPFTIDKWSDTDLEKKLKGGFWLRKWNSVDLTYLFLVIEIHVLAACSVFCFSWGALWVALVLAVITGIGVTLGYHRHLTHRSFKVAKWLEYFLVYCGSLASQRDPIYWVSVHKNHQKYVDTDKNPHTPKEGIWFSHMGWFLYNDYIAAKVGELRSGEYSNVPELKAQWFYRFLHSTHVWHHALLAILLYLHGGFNFRTWLGEWYIFTSHGTREVLISHFTYFVNSVCHTWGERPWNTRDTSTNNWWVAILSLGEGWHNNHHAFPRSAQHGMEWWQFDLTWGLIKFLEMVGLATDVKLPTEADKDRLNLHLDNTKQMKYK